MTNLTLYINRKHFQTITFQFGTRRHLTSAKNRVLFSVVSVLNDVCISSEQVHVDKWPYVGHFKQTFGFR